MSYICRHLLHKTFNWFSSSKTKPFQFSSVTSLCMRHRCKNAFSTFFILATFFYVSNVFLFKKTCIENPIKSFVKHFWNYRNELIGHSGVVYLVSPNMLNKTF